MTEWILSASILLAFLIVLRYLLRGRIGLRLQYALWALALVRLLVPVQFGAFGLSVTNMVPQPAAPVLTDTVPAPEDMAAPGYDPGDFQPVPALDAETEAETGPEASPAPAVNVTALDSGDVTLRATDWGEIARMVWLAGAGLLGLWLLATNLRFRHRLVRSRRFLDMPEAGLRVYVTEAIDTPCLFGLFRPAIYVTPEAAADGTLLRHAVAHEHTHYRHGDHIWALLRGICLALHWYNPLVWWAAELSRRDGELACDEAVIRRLGEAERAAYGRTLIAMTYQKRPALFTASTTMNAGRRSIRERIMLIARKPRTAVYTLVAVLLLSALAVGCTFTGAEGSPEPTAKPSPTVPQDVIVPVYQGVTVSDDLADLPESVCTWAAEYVEAAAADYMDMGAEQGFTVLSAQVTGLRQLPTGTAGLNSGQNLYLLEYRIAVDAPDKVPLTGGMRLEDGAITEWGSAGPTRYDLTARELTEVWDMIAALEPTPMETEPEGERLYRARLCMGRFSGDPDFAEMPEIYDLFSTNRDENGELTTIGYWAELNLDFLPDDVLDTSLGCYQCAPGSVDYALLQRIAENQTSITKSQADIDSALDAAREIIVGFGDTTVDALWYDEASSAAAIRQRLHVSAWEPYGNTANNLIALGFDMTRYGTAHQSRTLILERSGPDAPWAYCDMDKVGSYARPAEPVIPTELPDMMHLFKYWNGEPQATRYELTSEGLTGLWEMFRALPLTVEAERPQVNGNYYALEMYWGETRATVWFYESDRVWIEGAGESRGYICPAGSVDYALLEQVYASQPTISKSQADIDSAIAAAWDYLANSEVLDIWYDEDACTAAIYEKRHMTYRDPDSVSPDNLIAVGFDWIYNGQTMTNCTLYLERSGPDASWAYCDRSKAPTYAYPTA